MSMYLEFEPHSWYMGAAIRAPYLQGDTWAQIDWHGYLEDGMITYSVIEFKADTLRELKLQIKAWHAARNKRDAENRTQIERNK